MKDGGRRTEKSKKSISSNDRARGAPGRNPAETRESRRTGNGRVDGKKEARDRTVRHKSEAGGFLGAEPTRMQSFKLSGVRTMGDTYRMPNLAQRRAEPAARIAFFASIAQDHNHQFAGVPFGERDWHLIAMCNTCGQNTGNWCDRCETAGNVFVTQWQQTMVGSPLCTRCEGDRVKCNVCGHP